MTRSTDHDTENRAVSPVVGVVLILAITLLLVALTGSSLTNFGQDAANTAPQASLSVSVNAAGDTITINHDSGDRLAAERTRVVINIDGSESSWSETSASDALSVGEDATFDFSADPDTGPTSGAWNSYGQADGGADNEIDPGDEIVVEIIDVDTQQIVYKSRITA